MRNGGEYVPESLRDNVIMAMTFPQGLRHGVIPSTTSSNVLHNQPMPQ
jgi:hypothetical protein